MAAAWAEGETAELGGRLAGCSAALGGRRARAAALRRGRRGPSPCAHLLGAHALGASGGLAAHSAGAADLRASAQAEEGKGWARWVQVRRRQALGI